MGYDVKVLLDSISPGGARLTSFEVTVPRFVLSEVNTHRSLSKNSASSRAVPTKKFIDRVETDPVIPIEWGANQPGMVAHELLPADIEQECRQIWLEARDDAQRHASSLLSLGVHKQIVNRLLEPFLWHTMIISGTEFANFFAQRLDSDADPHIRKGAELMLQSFLKSEPQRLKSGEWHLPLIQADEQNLDVDLKLKLSAARCARVSYLTHAGVRDHSADLDLYERLLSGGGNGHWSPFEHQAQASADPRERSGNFEGWKQLRKSFAQEVVLQIPTRFIEKTKKVRSVTESQISR